MDAKPLVQRVLDALDLAERTKLCLGADRQRPRRIDNQPSPGPWKPVVTLNTHAHLFEKTDTAAATAIEAAMRTGPER